MDGIYQRKKLKQPFKRKTLKFILLYPTIDKKLASVERKNRCIYWIFNGADFTKNKIVFATFVILNEPYNQF
jgi:hypothetical protein